MRSNNRKTGKNQISNVRVVDPEDGADGATVDRMITQQQNSHSQVRVLCNATYAITLATTNTFVNYDGTSVIGMDDFVSMVQQWETYRIKAIKVDVYDIAPNTVVQNGGSTFHDVYTTVPSFTFDNIADGPDYRVVPPGTGKVTFHWLAKGTQENNFQSDSTVGTTSEYFGGVRFLAGAGTAGVVKYQVVMKAVVDFRGRR